MEEIQEKLANADPFNSWWPFIISAAVGIAITIKGFMGGQKCPTQNVNLSGKWIIVTGANGGIGRQLCIELCERGANLILACRNDDDKQTQIFLQFLQKKFPKSRLKAIQLDLSSFSSVRKFANEIEAGFDAIDVLINQAGVMFHPFETSEDGFEMHLQCNYLGHFLLTMLLLPLIKKAPQGRVVNVSAHAYSSGKIEFDDPLNLNGTEREFHARDAFSHSKLAIVLSTRHLAKLLRLSKSQVTVNCCSPGLIRGTGHFRRSPIMNALCAKIITYPWMWLFMRSPKQGAQTPLYLAIEPSLSQVTGEFFNDCEKTEVVGWDEQLALKITRASLKAVGVAEIKG